MTISLAFLAPDVVRAAVEGRLPRGIGVERLRDAPPEWSRQFEALGLNPQKLLTGFETSLLASQTPKIPGSRTGSGRRKPCRGERNFWMQRREAKSGVKDRKCHRRPNERNDTGENPQRNGLFRVGPGIRDSEGLDG